MTKPPTKPDNWHTRQKLFNERYVECMKRHGVYIEPRIAKINRLKREKKMASK